MIKTYRGKTPILGADVYVAENATLIGDVEIGAGSSIWFGAVLRGDVFHIRVGEATSIQDNSVVHVTDGRYPTLVGNRVTVGHSVTLHGCTVRDRVIVGMGSTVLDEAEIGERCILGAGSVVSPGTKIPPGMLALGAPARVKRPLTEEELVRIEYSADHYVELAKTYRSSIS
jgi:carbonic anhydrase/acetyltransferase-like protein (isoleucine patch superfamily)